MKTAVEPKKGNGESIFAAQKYFSNQIYNIHNRHVLVTHVFQAISIFSIMYFVFEKFYATFLEEEMKVA